VAGKRPTPADRSDRTGLAASVEVLLQQPVGSSRAGDDERFAVRVVAELDSGVADDRSPTRR
jgi:hypothetical protein